MTDDTDLREQIIELIPRLRRFALGLCGNGADADDLVQTALEKALTRLHQFQRGTRLDSWLFRIVQTSFIDDRRKAARREDDMETEILEQHPEVAKVTESRMGLHDIDQAMAQLSEEQRSLVLLVLVEGHSYQEAADLLEVPVGTVMSRLARARKALAALLQGGVN